MGGIKKAAKKIGGGIMGGTLGLLKGKKAPKAPDFKGTAEQQAANELEAAKQITKWNRPTQIDALGNKITWTQDKAGNWTQKVTPSADIAASNKMGQSALANALREVQGMGKFTGPASVQFDPTAGDKMAADMYESVMGRARPEQEREKNSIDLKLRQQGLQPGTEAYDRAMKNLMTAHGDVATQAGLESTAAGYEEARQRFAQQLQAQNQEYGQAMQNYSMPLDRAGTVSNLVAGLPGTQFQGFSGATGYNPADLTGAARDRYAAKMGGYNAQQQKKSNTLGAGAGLGSAAIMASDAALKTNIERVDGREALAKILQLSGYKYDWKSNDLPGMGILAQEVEKVLPELVSKAAAGHLRVNYGALLALCVEAIKYLAEEKVNVLGRS